MSAIIHPHFSFVNSIFKKISIFWNLFFWKLQKWHRAGFLKRLPSVFWINLLQSCKTQKNRLSDFILPLHVREADKNSYPNRSFSTLIIIFTAHHMRGRRSDAHCARRIFSAVSADVEPGCEKNEILKIENFNFFEFFEKMHWQNRLGVIKF